MAQHNNDRVSDLMSGAQPKGGSQFRSPTRIPAPIPTGTPDSPDPEPAPIREPPTDAARSSTSSAAATASGIPLHFRELMFSGFEPSDTVSSLFRLWKGKFMAVRSDNERFWVDVAFQQSDTPYVTGPVVESALEQLMAYSRCACRPSVSAVCKFHAEPVS